MAIKTFGEVKRGKTLISTTLVTAGVSSIAISSIPQIYTDLEFVWRNIVYSAYTGVSSSSVIRFNSDTAINYRWHASSPDTTTSTSSAKSASAARAWSDTNTSLSVFQGYSSDDSGWGWIRFYRYTSSSEKLIESHSYQGENIARQVIVIGTYRGSAITSINITPNAAFTYTSGTLLLYGIV